MIFFLANKLLKMLSKISAKKGYEFLSEMSDEDAVRNVDYLAHALRRVKKGGAGIALYPVSLALTQARKVILRKEKRGMTIYGFEKWIKDNYRLLASAIKGIEQGNFATLPHVGGVPRIVIVADFIVKYSAGKISYEKIAKVLAAFQAVTPLTYSEIESIKDALAYRLLFEISLFAERSIHYYAEYLRAEKKKFDKKSLSDSYLTFYTSLHSESDGSFILSGRDVKAAALGFENLLADNELLTSTFVNSLRELPKCLDVGKIVSLSTINESYREDESYRNMSDLAKSDYLKKTHDEALRLNVSESVVSHAALFLAERHKLHFGEILYHYPEALRRYLRFGAVEALRDEKSKVQGGYAAFVLSLSLVIAAFPAYYLRNLWAYLSVLPLFIISLHPVEYLLKRFLSMKTEGKPLPQMDYAVLPEEMRTVVVACRFIANEGDARDALLQAETLAASARDPAIHFAVLADFPSSEEEWGEKDRTLAEYLSSLPRSSAVSIFIRKRVRKGNKYVGYERKRGAILDFLSAVRSGEYGKFRYIGELPCANYAVLLDDDSEVLPGTIRSAILAMAHPLNREYDLMSFGGRINRFSLKTHYAVRFARSCGVDAYPYYSDFYSDAFDCALYCGKAIVRIAPYLDKLKDFFPDGRILSHDIIEGAVLHSASVKRCVYEDAPATFAGDAIRSARWQRGDVQLLPYAFCNRVKDRFGKRIPNPIAPIYKLIIFINGVSVLRDFMTALVLLLGFFSGTSFLLYYVLSCHVFAKVYALVDALRGFFGKSRIAHSFRAFVHSVELLAEEILLIPFRAVCGVYLFFITIAKMIVRSSSLLEWTPFRATQGAGGADDGAKLLLPSAVLLSALTILAGDLRITLYAMAVFVYFFYLLITGREIRSASVAEKDRNVLKEYAGKIYRYFEDMYDDGLITDNCQCFPYEMKSDMTSPTNMGFAILAEICAVKLGLVPKEGAIARIGRRLEQVEGLEKWEGHLYNWYDIHTGRVMTPRVVSTVDSANFTACLIVAEDYLSEEGEIELANRAKKLAEDADFTALYDPSEKLLAIVKYPEENRFEGRYDLLASEARLAYYLAIGQGVDVECYFTLGRDCVSMRGNTLLSWSGTAFEYMLPRLFLRAPAGSLLCEQEYRSAQAQIAEKTQGLFGRSECGYADFNDATAYRYKAVGCESLAMSEDRADVIAPYASFLYLPCIAKSCLENLSLLRKQDAEGKYGFYEGVDFEHSGEIVKSFMTHHQGMSLAAITNYLCEDELVRLFSSSPTVRSVRLLLTEENVVLRQPKRYPKCREREEERREIVCMPTVIPEAVVLRSGEYTAMYDALGRSYAKLGDVFLTKYRDTLREKGGVFLQIRDGDIHTSPCYLPYESKGAYSVFREGTIEYRSESGDTCEEVYPLAGFDGEMRVLTLRNEGDEIKQVTVSAYADMQLNGQEAYDSHPAFSDMFVTAECDEEGETEYLYRRNGQGEITVAASFSVKGLTDAIANCNAYNVIGRGGSMSSDFAEGIAREDAPRFGSVLYPCFAFSGQVKIPPHSLQKVYFCLLGARDLDSLRERNRRIDLAYRSGAIELIGKGETAESGDLPRYLSLCGDLLYRRTSEEALAIRYSRRDELAKYGINHEDILLLDLTTTTFAIEKAKEAALLSLRLREVGILHKLVIVIEKRTGAGMSGEEALKKALGEMGAEAIVVGSEAGELFRLVAKVNLGERREREKDEPTIRDECLPNDCEDRELLYPTGEGGLVKEGYQVIPFSKETLLPYANVVGCRKGGFVATERGGGFTFGANSREEKVTYWSGDALRDPPSERVILCLKDKQYRLNANHCEHRVGATIYTHAVEGMSVRVSLTPACEGRAKVYEIVLGGDAEEGSLVFSLLPALGWRFSDKVFVEKTGNGYRLIEPFGGKTAEVYLIEGGLRYHPPTERGEPLRFETTQPLAKGGYHIVLASEGADRLSLETLAFSRAKALSQVSKNALSVDTGELPLDVLYNRVLPYQTMSSRLNARTGFYQCGGAVGFRDQLQDCLAFLLSDPQRVREQILDAAAHQYEEGDAQHWWHPPRTGVRTRISDDRLWLVFVTTRYIECTADTAILDVEIPFLRSPALGAEEMSRYEIPQIGESASLAEHLLRAIDATLSFGEHGLLKIGSGDWNDGLDRVGVRGRGESVWLTMFAYKTISDAIPLFCAERRRIFAAALERLSDAVKPLMKDGRYPLAFTDDGKWLGYKDTSECTLALNPQTWAVISGIVPAEDAKRALETAKLLVDSRYDLVKLSTPPFDKSSNYGYIAAYPKGVRENGGQYTHAAVWYLKALLERDEREEAYRILTMLNPLIRCSTEEGTKRYRAEPYVLSGDVYGAAPYCGRGGWSWYTGSAGWLYYVLTEDFFGIRKRGDRLYVKPRFPSSFDKLSCELRLGEKVVSIEYIRSDRDALYREGREREYLNLAEAGEEIRLLCHFR